MTQKNENLLTSGKPEKLAALESSGPVSLNNQEFSVEEETKNGFCNPKRAA